MSSILRLHKLQIVVVLFLMAVGCTQAASTGSDSSTISKDYQSYSKDGLSLRYPKHWKFTYDDPQGLYSDRAVAFDATEYSRLTIYIYNKPGGTVSDVADIFVKRLKLEKKEHIKNYVRSPTKVGNYDGIKLSWTNAMLAPYSIEMSVLPIGSSPYHIFAVFDLTEEDIERESGHMLPILESIKYNQ